MLNNKITINVYNVQSRLFQTSLDRRMQLMFEFYLSILYCFTEHAST